MKHKKTRERQTSSNPRLSQEGRESTHLSLGTGTTGRLAASGDIPDGIFFR